MITLVCDLPPIDLHGDAVEVFANRDSSAQRTISAIEVLVLRRPHAGAAVAGDLVETLEF